MSLGEVRQLASSALADRAEKQRLSTKLCQSLVSQHYIQEYFYIQDEVVHAGTIVNSGAAGR